MHTAVPFSLFTTLALGASLLAQSAPCFEPNLGTNLNAGDDTVAYNNALGFTFPGPGGPVTAIDISSNGFLWLGTNPNHGSECCQGDVNFFLSEDPRVAGYWMDLYPPGGGGVFFNAIAASPSGPARAVITWNNVPEYFNSPAVTVQVQLVSTGEILISHAASNVAPQQFHQPIVGVTQGLNATSNVVQFASIPGGGASTGTNPTAFQQYTLPPNYDLAGRTMWFLPNTNGGYIINQVCSPPPVPPSAMYTTFGMGCPQPPVVYEFLPGTSAVTLTNQSFLFVPNGQGGWVVLPGSNQFFNGFTNNLNLGDDAVATVTMPFAFNHPAGSTSSLDVCSNGRVWLASNPSGIAYNPVVQDFLNDPASIGVLWADFYPPGAPAGGGVFADPAPNNQAYYVTWSNVPMYNGANGVGSNTMQLALFNNGQFELRYQSVTNNATTGGDALRGYSTGNGATDPGNRNLATSVPFSTGSGGTTLTLAATGGGRPVLGQVFNQDIGGISAGSPLGFMILGFTSYAPAGIDLTPLGAPGCHQYQSLDADLLFLVAAPGTTTFGLSIPNNTSLSGMVIFSQAAVLAPNVNALGIVASNGASLSLGI